jgi:GT2 family glycosyltransferase
MTQDPARPPRVAVLIVAYNSGPHLQGALDAIAAQTWRDFEIILWDNASRDGAAERARLPANARFIRCESNLGFAGGNNAAARETGAELLALLNPDAVPEPRWLERLVAALDADPRAVMAASRQVSAEDPSRLDGLGDVYHVSGVCYRGGFGAKSAGETPAGEVFAPCGAAALYRRAAFDAAGGFDERFFCYIEDVDLAFRLRLAGGACVFVPDATVRHVGSATMGQRSEFALYHGVRNRIWAIVKDVPGALLPVTLPLHAAVLAVQLVKAPFHSRAVLSGTWRGIWDGVIGAPRFLPDRRRIQASRRVSLADIAGAMTWSPWKLLKRAPDIRPRPAPLSPATATQRRDGQAPSSSPLPHYQTSSRTPRSGDPGPGEPGDSSVVINDGGRSPGSPGPGSPALRASGRDDVS